MAVIILNREKRTLLVGRPDSFEGLVEQIYAFLGKGFKGDGFTIYMKPAWAREAVEVHPSAYEEVQHTSELYIMVEDDDDDFEPTEGTTRRKAAPTDETNTGDIKDADGEAVNVCSLCANKSTAISVRTSTGSRG